MSIRVLLADDSDVMRDAIRKVLAEEQCIKLVGEAASFGQTMQMIADFKPDVLLLDLHMAEKRDFAPAFVKSQLASVDRVIYCRSSKPCTDFFPRYAPAISVSADGVIFGYLTPHTYT